MAQEDLRELLRETTEDLERIAAGPNLTATVTAVKDGHLQIISSAGSSVILAPRQALGLGDQILINPESKQFLKRSPFLKPGLLGEVVDTIEDFAVVESQGQRRLIPHLIAVKTGDQVLLDDFGSFIMEVLPPAKQNHVAPPTNVHWDDVRGNDEAKQALIEAIEHPHLHPELFTAYGAKPAKGILLYGPPGCGKTMLGKAAATSMGAIEGFIHCKGPEILNEYVGVSEGKIRALFARARRFKAESGKNALIFIDEADSILGERSHRHSFMEKTIVPQFLSEMDGIEESGAIVILATNRSQSLDTAVVREGRIDRKVKVSRPNPIEAHEIVVRNLRSVPVQGDAAELAEKAVIQAWSQSFTNNGREYVLSEFVSGAMFAELVAKAKSSAMRRDLDTRIISGIGADDFTLAVSQTARELAAISLSEHT